MRLVEFRSHLQMCSSRVRVWGYKLLDRDLAESFCPTSRVNEFCTVMGRLYYDLQEHPEIYMSPLKEPCYFASEVRPENFALQFQARMREQQQATSLYLRGEMTQKRFGGIVSEWDDYLRLFERAGNQKAIGEGSVCYLWSRSAASGIASQAPDSKIIIVLMNPAERAYAQYRKSLSNGDIPHSFRQHLEACLQHSDGAFSPFHPFLEFGMYSQQVERYLACFPRRQIRLSLYEDVTRDYECWFAQTLFAFLEVDTRVAPKSHRDQAVEQAAAAEMSAQDRALLVDYYRDDILELEELIARRLCAWLR